MYFTRKLTITRLQQKLISTFYEEYMWQITHTLIILL